MEHTIKPSRYTLLDDTLQDIVGLLGMLPGIVVTSCERTRDVVQITFYVADGASLAALQREVEGANVALDPWIRHAFGEAVRLDAPVRHTITANCRAFDSIQFGYLQLLGIHLTWHLHRVGALTAEDANARLDRWRAVRVDVARAAR